MKSRGFAIGAHKLAYQTADGGKTWEPIAAAAEPQTDPEYTVYNNITFVTAKTGMIGGFSAPPRPGEDGKPDWLDAQDTSARREWPHLSIMLDTRDGGKTWNSFDVIDVRPHHADLFSARWPRARPDRIHRHFQVAVGGALAGRHDGQKRYRLQRHRPGHHGCAAAAIRDRVPRRAWK